MTASNGWNWDIGKRVVADLGAVVGNGERLRERQPSADGERFAAILELDTNGFAMVADGQRWSGELEKAWHLRFGADGRAMALVRIDDQWTMMVDGAPWGERFQFAWNPKSTPDGKVIACMVKRDDQYGIAVDGAAPAKLFLSCRDFALSNDGRRVAATVQLEEMPEAGIAEFAEGTWGIAVDGEPWPTRFLNTYAPAFSPDGAHVAAEVRTDLYDYSVAKDSQVWQAKFGCVWEPRFRDNTSVLVPIRQKGGWTLAENGVQIWKNRFVQLWHHHVAPQGDRIAAIVATSYGRWTIAVDDQAWPQEFSDMVLRPHFSPDGRHIAAAVKDKGRWGIAVDGKAWAERFDMVWEPLFSPDGEVVVAQVEQNGRRTLVANGKPWKYEVDDLWAPAFSPDGKRLLVRGAEGAKMFRQVIPTTDLVS
jgi:hypothetical protein